ncbi:MAG: tetratricopeptide repeat protein [Cyanobacteria bacterium P01_G01_bin.38]
MLELTFTLVVFAGWVISVCLHEFGHAVVAYFGGDTSVKDKGYLTLNPLKYTNPGLSFMMPLLFLLLGGIPLPGAAVYINQSRLKNRLWKSAVSAAGPLASFLCAVLIAVGLSVARPGVYQQLFTTGAANSNALATAFSQIWFFQAMAFLLTLEVAAVLLNLLPMPGLDGYGIIEPWLPPGLRIRFNKLRRYGFIALFAAFWLIPSFNAGFWGVVDAIAQLLGVSPVFAAYGFMVFRQSSQIILIVLIVALVIANQLRKQSPAPASDKLSAPELQNLLTEVDETLAVLPQDWEAWQRRGAILVELGRYDKALEALDRAIAANPKAVKVLNFKGWLLASHLERCEDAMATLEKSLAIKPGQPDVWHLQGITQAQLGQPKAALADFDRAIQLNPKYEAAWFSKSATLFALAEYAQALKAIDQVLKIAPRRADALYNKACCYAQLGEISLGITWLEKSLALDAGALREQAKDDGDLGALRSHPSFSALIGPK